MQEDSSFKINYFILRDGKTGKVFWDSQNYGELRKLKEAHIPKEIL